MRFTKDKTNRGFDIIKFDDLYGIECNIQKSSLAFEDALWIGINEPEPKIMALNAKEVGIQTDATTGWIDYPIPDAVLIPTRMHLTREQVKELIPILQQFVDTGNIL